DGQSRLVPFWFRSLAGRYERWAGHYLDKRIAVTLHDSDVAGTEWPMFGSVFFLVTAEELQRQGLLDARQGEIRRAVEKAREIVVSPDTATWVKTKWGDDYLVRKNLFYRMLLIMGTAAYEEITGDLRCRELMSQQRESLALEMMAAPFHLLDDYPGECWPVDNVLALAALQRAAIREETNHNELVRAVIATLDGALSVSGLPPCKVDAMTGQVLEGPRGCGISGLMLFVAEVDPERATRWYNTYARDFWKQNAWLAGFTEMPRALNSTFTDVDSGPVVFGLGSVASAFGIGAAKAVGRYDHAATLTLEAVACSWPTPFGFILPMSMGKLAMDGACLGETGLLLAMTRPNRTDTVIPFKGRVPLMVWVMFLMYIGVGVLFVSAEVRFWRRRLRQA
ncbi:MAG: hypothetical protein FWH21_08630, partial [Kiritimatiellaeota bacterium]|nr:hypothetical protein [Kiritimatiellota bacterium]